MARKLNSARKLSAEEEAVLAAATAAAESFLAEEDKTEVKDSPVLSNFAGVEIRRPDEMVWSFGSTRSPKQYLSSFGAIRGFMNALQDLNDGVYKAFAYGVHLKVDPKDFANEYNRQDVGHFRLQGLDLDCPVASMIMDMDLSNVAEDRWYTLNLVHGVLKIGFKVDALIAADLKELYPDGAPLEVIERNKEHWGRYFKQEGIELALRVMKGYKRVICAYKPRGFDGEIRGLQLKFNQFVLDQADRRAERNTAMNNGIAARTNRVVTAQVEKNDVVRAAAEEASENLIVLVDGEETPVTVSQLVRATVKEVRGAWIGALTYLGNESNVKAAALQAQRHRAKLMVVRFA